MTFERFFEKATGNKPFPFQERFARHLPELVQIPTGLGKTAMAVVGWLWRRCGGDEKLSATTPRRLVYCLPMRVLVEQTRDHAVLWLHNLDLLGGKADFEEDKNGKPRLRFYEPNMDDPNKVAVHVLMGGEKRYDWDLYPERNAILVGTQDMLLSQALNRGYALSRARWPMPFGLLHMDSLWIFDEIQLMGAGLATTTQLEAFRRLLPDPKDERAKHAHGCCSVWMSATLERRWLETVDFKPYVEKLESLKLAAEDRAKEEVKKRWNAKKHVEKSDVTMGEIKNLSRQILKAHRLGTRTLVVVNTVRRACDLWEELQKERKKGKSKNASAVEPEVVLLHSRFRPKDRNEAVEKALAAPPGWRQHRGQHPSSRGRRGHERSRVIHRNSPMGFPRAALWKM